MADIKFRFPEEAHALYGDGWYEIDFEAVAGEVDAGVLERFEDQTGFMVLEELPDLLSRGSFRALHAAVWLAVLIAGHRVKWAVFKKDVHTDPRRIEWEAPDEDSGDEDVEGEQGGPPPPNRAARRAASKAAPSGT